MLGVVGGERGEGRTLKVEGYRWALRSSAAGTTDRGSGGAEQNLLKSRGREGDKQQPARSGSKKSVEWKRRAANCHRVQGDARLGSEWLPGGEVLACLPVKTLGQEFFCAVFSAY